MRQLLNCLRSRPRLTVLMYHRVADDESDPHAVKPEIFKRQIHQLSSAYQLIGATELLGRTPVSVSSRGPAVWLTFDDATEDLATVVVPTLARYGIPATAFVPTASLGRSATWASSGEEGRRLQVLDAAALRELQLSGLELGHHSHSHVDFTTLSTSEWAGELRESQRVAKAQSLEFLGVFAYPFGRRPKTPETRDQLATVFGQFGIELAVRAGTRSQRLPLDDPFAIHRCQVTDRDVGESLDMLIRRPRRARRLRRRAGVPPS